MPNVRSFLSLMTLLLFLTAWPVIAKERVERSTVLRLGNPSGFQEAVYAEDGSVRVHYEFNDRGRGPKLDAHYTLAADGTVETARIDGLAYFKTPVAETFQRTRSTTEWRNGSEQETRAERLPGQYLSLEAVPEEGVLMTRALLKATDGRLPVLPVGSVSIERVRELKLKGTDREQVTAVLYALSGLDLTPGYLWLDRDQRFLASCSDWMVHIREGLEAHAPTLLAAQQEVEREQIIERSKRLTQTLERPLLITGARLFDPLDLSLSAGMSVLIESGRVKAIGRDGELTAGEQVERRDAGGRFLMPGLWDMHVHLNGSNDGLLFIASGITTVRDLANDRDALLARIKSFEAGADIGPRVIRAGFVDGRSPYSGPTKVFADNEDEVRAAMAQFGKDGFEQVKVYSSLKPELVPLFAELAHAQGMRLSGHVPQGMSAEQFVKAGADEIQHANFLMLNFLADESVDTRTPQRFGVVAARGTEVDLSGPDMRRLIDLLVERKTVIDPTLVTFEGLFLDRPGSMGPTYADTVHRLPPVWQRFVHAANGGLAVSKDTDLIHRASYRRMVDLVGLMYRSGVTVVAGTDTLPLFALARELELYTHAGIAPAETLRIATLGAARVMNREREYGRVAPGFVADLVLIDGDPTRLITDLRRVHTVIRGDRRYLVADLYRSVGISP